MALPSIRAGLDTLRANPLRTLLSTLGVIMGAASLVAVLSLGDGAEAFARQRILQEGYNHVVVEPILSDIVDGQSIARASVVSLTPVDADAAAPIVNGRAIGALFVQGSMLWSPGAAASAGSSTAGPATGATNGAAAAPPGAHTPGAASAGAARGVRVTGLAPVGGSALPASARIEHGRALTPQEARDGAAACIVSHGFAALLAGGNTATSSTAGASSAASSSAAPAAPAPGTPASATPAPAATPSATTPSGAPANADPSDASRALGMTLALAADRSCRITGIQEDFVGQRGFSLILPLAQAEPLLRTPQRRIVLEAARVEEVPSLTSDMRAWADARAGWRGGIRVSAPGQRRLEEIGRGIVMFKMLMGAFTAIALIVGGIGIMNVLLASVVERTREIGIRKAVGARRRDILTQFLTESVAIASAGSLVGLAIGLAGAFGVTAVMRARTAMLIFAGFSWGTLAASASAALLVGLVFGTYPALRASRLSPIDAITRE